MTSAKIMIVEDEFVIAEDLTRQLEDQGYRVSSNLYTGEEAIARARKDKPHLILMDIKLGGKLDGFQAAQVIQQDCRIPVIFLTSFSIPEIEAQTPDSKSFSYLFKPIEPEKLRTAIVMAFFRAAMGYNLS